MSIWGKVIGGVGGFWLGGPLGAVIGGVAGHAYDRIRSEQVGADPLELLRGEGGGWGPGDPPGPARRSPGASGPDARRTAFGIGIVVLAAKMAKADGRVTRAEINAFRDVFQIAPEDLKTVGAIFNQAKRDAHGFEPYAEQIATVFHGEPQVLEELLAGLFHIAKADGVISSAEMAFLRQVADIFGLGGRPFERISAMFNATMTLDPYSVLEVAPTASNDEVKQAWRRLIRLNHPDILVAKGLPEEAVQLANEKMASINAAYEAIEKERQLR